MLVHHKVAFDERNPSLGRKPIPVRDIRFVTAFPNRRKAQPRRFLRRNPSRCVGPSAPAQLTEKTRTAPSSENVWAALVETRCPLKIQLRPDGLLRSQRQSRAWP